MITKLQITGKLHYHRKCDFQLSKRKLGYRTLLPLTAPIGTVTSFSWYFAANAAVFWRCSLIKDIKHTLSVKFYLN